MVQRGDGGAIVNVSSLSSLRALKDHSVYCELCTYYAFTCAGTHVYGIVVTYGAGNKDYMGYIWDNTKSGLWTLDWAMNWTLDYELDSFLSCTLTPKYRRIGKELG